MFGCVLLNVSTIRWSRSSSVLPADQPESVTVVAVAFWVRASAAEATTTVSSTRTTDAATAARILRIGVPPLETRYRPPPHCGSPGGYTARPVPKHSPTFRRRAERSTVAAEEHRRSSANEYRILSSSASTEYPLARAANVKAFSRCRGRDSNPHAPEGTPAFKAGASHPFRHPGGAECTPDYIPGCSWLGSKRSGPRNWSERKNVETAFSSNARALREEVRCACRRRRPTRRGRTCRRAGRAAP